MLWKFLLIASLFQDSVDLLSLSRFLAFVENQHSKLLKFYTDSNINGVPSAYQALCNRVKSKWKPQWWPVLGWGSGLGPSML